MGAFGGLQRGVDRRIGLRTGDPILDVDLPLPPGMKTYDTVVDFGTIEHVFKIAQAMENLVALCREGGQHPARHAGQRFLRPWLLADIAGAVLLALFRAQRLPRHGSLRRQRGKNAFALDSRSSRP